MILYLMLEYSPTDRKLFVRGVFDPKTPRPAPLNPGNSVNIIAIALDADNGNRITFVRDVALTKEDA